MVLYDSIVFLPGFILMVLFAKLDRVLKSHGMPPALIGGESRSDGYHEWNVRNCSHVAKNPAGPAVCRFGRLCGVFKCDVLL